MAVKHIISPFDKNEIKKLKAGDQITLSGRIVTARDQIHKYLASKGKLPIDIKGHVIYHCGPVVIKKGNAWSIIAAGPTTSIREEPYEAAIIKKFQPGAIMGKGGMGKNTLTAMKKFGCVYLSIAGGAAISIARHIKKVEAVYMLEEFGQPEAMWILNVEKLPALVTMDSHGRSLYEGIRERSEKRFYKLIDKK
jgi:fumarate hydratase class I